MRLATLKTTTGTTAAVQDGDGFAPIDGIPDVGALLASPDWQEAAGRALAGDARVAGEEATLLQVVTDPGKIICAGLNYRSHILEMGRGLPDYPTLFAKFTETLTGPFDDIVAVSEDPALDWEGELVIVVGKQARAVSEADAPDYIGGYTIANDISMRTWQFRTKEWLQGKIWESSTPLGPVVVTPDEIDLSAAQLVTSVNGEVMQQHSIGDLLFTPAYLLSYVSTMITLNPGDVILTGTPGGVGRARKPEVYLKAGDEVTVEIDGIGALRNSVVSEESAHGREA